MTDATHKSSSASWLIEPLSALFRGLEFDDPRILTLAMLAALAGAVLTAGLWISRTLRRRRADESGRTAAWPFTLPWRLLLLAAVLVILAVPMLRQSQPSRRSVLYVVDWSASVKTSRASLTEYIQRQNAERLGADDVYGVILCAEGVRLGVPYPTTASVTPNISWDDAHLGRMASDVAAGLKAARTTLNRATRGTIVLLSDGHFDAAAAVREAELLKNRAVDLEIVELPCAAPQDVTVQSMLLPTWVHEGRIVRVRGVLENSGAETAVQAHLNIDGMRVESREVRLDQGTTVVDFEFVADKAKSGSHLVKIEIEAKHEVDEVSDNNYRISPILVVGDTRVLIIEGKPGASKYIQDSLIVAQVKATTGTVADLTPTNLDVESFDVIALVNVPAADVAEAAVAQLEHYARNGGGIVVYGGDRSFDCGQYRGSTLEQRLLPVISEEKHPGSDKAVGIFVLLIDISGSMQGRRLELAKQVGSRTLSGLRAGMAASVIGFDAGVFVIAAPVVVTPQSKKDMIDGVNTLECKGGTDILPAMQQADVALKQARERPGFGALAAHLIVISDGEAPNQRELEAQAALLKSRQCTVHTVQIVADASSGALDLMKAVAKSGGGRAELYDGTKAPFFELKENEVQEEKARLDFARDKEDLIFAPELQAQGFLRRLVWDYNGFNLKPTARLSLGVLDPRRPKTGGGPSAPTYAWHYLGDVGAGRVVACGIDVDGLWSKGLLESPAKNVLLGDPILFCRRMDQKGLISAAAQLNPLQADEVIVTVWGNVPKNAVLNLVPPSLGLRESRDELVPLFPDTPLSYQGRFRKRDARDVYEFVVVKESTDGDSLDPIGSVRACLNPQTRTAEQVPPVPNRAVLESLAKAADGEVLSLTDSIRVPDAGISEQRDRLWNSYFASALMALLLVGTVVRLEPPRSRWWTQWALFIGLVLFLLGVFYAIVTPG